MAHRVPSSEDASSTNVTFYPLSISPMSRNVPHLLEDAKDHTGRSRNTNFKPLVLGEIQAGGDNHHLHAVATLVAAVAEATFVFIIARRIGLEIGARQIIEEHVEGSGEQILPTLPQMKNSASLCSRSLSRQR